jgi:hypothetical protein
MQQQDRQERPLLAPAQSEDAVALDNLQRTEKPEFHFASLRVTATLPRA